MADIGWIHEILGAMATGDGDKTAAFFAEDGCVDDVGMGLRFTGRRAIAKLQSRAADFSSNARFEVENAMSDGELFAVQWRFIGTRNSNGKAFDYRAASLGQLRDGLITCWSDYWNPAHLTDQVGPWP